MDPSIPDLAPLCRVHIDLGDLHHVEVAGGRRLVGTMIGSRWEGERLRASQVGTSTDWMVYEPDALATVDVRLLLRTDDGADLLVRYCGRSDLDAGAITTAAFFETGDQRYRWLNRIVAVGRGRADRVADAVDYDLFEVC